MSIVARFSPTNLTTEKYDESIREHCDSLVRPRAKRGRQAPVLTAR